MPQMNNVWKTTLKIPLKYPLFKGIQVLCWKVYFTISHDSDNSLSFRKLTGKKLNLVFTPMCDKIHLKARTPKNDEKLKSLPG